MNCQICGAALPSDALFCGECGSSTSATPLSRQRPDTRSSDTTLIQPIQAQQGTGVISVSVAGEAVSPHGAPAEADTADDTADASDTAAAEPGTESSAGQQSFIGEFAAALAADGPHASDSGAAFVLHVSTGESFDVSGSGLLGRRPLPADGEQFDHLIQINDTGRSVSKCHLEFGQYDGELWISDRDSGNGTLLRRPDGSMLACEPGRRYLTSRGTRVEIGEQFFVVA